MYYFLGFILWLLCCFIIAEWARAYNRQKWNWFFTATLLTPIIGAIGLLASGYNGKKCPGCAEFIKPEALKCKHCGHEFN